MRALSLVVVSVGLAAVSGCAEPDQWHGFDAGNDGSAGLEEDGSVPQPMGGEAGGPADGAQPDAASAGTSPADGNGSTPDARSSLETASGATLGAACQRGADCASGFCADGVCCNEACGQTCAACAQPGNAGTCLPVTGAPRGQRPACTGSGPCAGSCDGKDPAACHFPGAAVVCGMPSCTAGMATPPATCDGRGACVTAAPISCAPDPCDGTACGQCSNSRPCANGYQCANGKCMPKVANGGGCQRDDQCTSGHCAEGLCCDRACAGACEACDVPGKAGVCSYLAGTVCRAATGACDVAETCTGGSSDCPADGKRPGGYTCRAAAGDCDSAETCDGASSACPPDSKQSASTVCRASAGPCDLAETCDGASSTCPPDAKRGANTACRPSSGPCDLADTCDGSSSACVDRKQPSGTSCRAGTCSNGTATPPGECDANGACADVGSGGSCGRYVCGATQCKMTCGSTSDCTSSNFCDPSSHCVPCPHQSSANLISNAGFDQSISPWFPTLDQWALDHGAEVRFNALDSDTCTSSGSVQLIVGDQTNAIVSQCIGVASGTDLNFGGRFLSSTVPEAVVSGGTPWNGYCGLHFFASITDCQTNTGEMSNRLVTLHERASQAGVWFDFSQAWFAPSGTGAVMYRCEMLDDGATTNPRPYLLVDKVFLRTSGTGF